MRSEFKELSMSTLIGDYPSLFNYNFNAVRNELDYYFDSSNGRLTKSVYAPNGRVDTFWGKFTNLEAEHFTITGTNITFDKSFLEGLSGHNNLGFRFSYDFSDSEKSSAVTSYRNYLSGTASEIGWRSYFVHDDNVILSTHEQSSDFFKYASSTINGYTLRDELDFVESEISRLIRHGNVKVSSENQDNSQDFDDSSNDSSEYTYTSSLYGSGIYGNTLNPNSMSKQCSTAYISALESEIEGYAYSPDVFGLPKNAANAQMKRKSDFKDIRNKHSFVYINNKNGYVKIDNTNIYAINTASKGDIVYIIFRPEKDNDNDFEIRLNDKEKIIIRKNDFRLAKLQLICTECDEIMKWDIYGYSGNIKIEDL